MYDTATPLTSFRAVMVALTILVIGMPTPSSAGGRPDSSGQDLESTPTLSAGPAAGQKEKHEKPHYYRDGKKVPLEVRVGRYYVLLDPKMEKRVLSRLLKPGGAIVRRFETVKPPTGLNLVEKTTSAQPNWAIIDCMEPGARPFQLPALSKSVRYTAPFFVLANGTEVGLSHLLYVKLKDECDRGKLQAAAKKYRVKILGNNKLQPQWYTLSCSNESSGNSLEVANKLFESGQFAIAEPDFLVGYDLGPMVPKQKKEVSAPGDSVEPAEPKKNEPEEVYYYRGGKKVALGIRRERSYILVGSAMSRDALARLLRPAGAVVRRFGAVKPPTGLRLVRKSALPKQNWAIVDLAGSVTRSLREIEKELLYKAPFVVLENGEEMGLSHLLYVKLKTEADRGKLEAAAKEHKLEILGNNEFQRLWFTLSCSKESSGNSLEVANKLFESGRFAVAEPDFLTDFQLK